MFASGKTAAVASAANYIEDCFSTYLYNGNEPNSVTVNNGIDLSTKGGLVWIKARETAKSNWLWDTARGTGSGISSNTTGAAVSFTGVSAFNTNGFTVGSDAATNDSTRGMVSWTFRKQPKFFDVVTWTGNGANRTISHALGSVPACIIVKRTDTTGDWQVYHRSLANTEYLVLNTTAAKATGATRWNSTTPTSTVFSLGTDATVNASGGTYVAYIFAHNAGGFGLTGTDNVISCGSYTGNGSTDGPVINLGYEPQWLLIKSSSAAFTGWVLFDNMRGMTVGGADAYLAPSSSDAETTSLDLLSPTATGFKLTSTLGSVNGGNDYIYIAIRRGPMKVPTSGTSVFAPVARTGTSAIATVTSGFATDMVVIRERSVSGTESGWYDKVRGPTQEVRSNLTNAEVTNTSTQEVSAFINTGITLAAGSNYVSTNSSGFTYINWMFRRAPNFFDVVCYTGTGSARTVAHNLGVAPELMIVKDRGPTANNWLVYASAIGPTKFFALDLTTAPFALSSIWNNTAPTSTVFTVGTNDATNKVNDKFVAYLFATCAGVSKVGSYTGNGSTQTINCGFTGGARFVLIRRYDSTGDWYVWDTARGIVSANDPHLSLNTTAAEVTTDDTIDTDSTGFIVNQVTATNVNVSSATYIYLAIA